MKSLLLATAMLAAISSSAIACAPTPTCFVREGKDYLRSICKEYARDGKTLTQIAKDADIEEPENVPAFGQACKQIGITLKR